MSTAEQIQNSKDNFIRTWARDIVTLAARRVHGVTLDIDETVVYLNEFMRSDALIDLDYRKLPENTDMLHQAHSEQGFLVNQEDVGFWLPQTFYELNSVVRKADRAERSVHLQAWSQAIHNDLSTGTAEEGHNHVNAEVIGGYLQTLFNRPELQFLRASEIEGNLDLVLTEIEADKEDEGFARNKGFHRPDVDDVRQVVLSALTRK